jgi:hypothetical protein
MGTVPALVRTDSVSSTWRGGETRAKPAKWPTVGVTAPLCAMPTGRSPSSTWSPSAIPAASDSK